MGKCQECSEKKVLRKGWEALEKLEKVLEGKLKINCRYLYNKGKKGSKKDLFRLF